MLQSLVIVGNSLIALVLVVQCITHANQSLNLVGTELQCLLMILGGVAVVA